MFVTSGRLAGVVTCVDVDALVAFLSVAGVFALTFFW